MPISKNPRTPGTGRGNFTPDVCTGCGVALTEANWKPWTRALHVKRCATCYAERSRRYYVDHRETRLTYHRSYYRNSLKPAYQAIRAEAIAVYGGRCACCGESIAEFLEIDHIEGGGTRHKKSLGGNAAYSVYRWLKERGWPRDGFQLLCSNCNGAKWAHGTCPHQRESLPTSFPWALKEAA